MLASLSSSITSQIASHGVYAVFLLMALGAVFPIGSELVALYAGALASGVLSSASHVSLFGSEVSYGAGAFIVLALAGTLGYFVGALVGWTIGRYGGRPLLERHGRWLHVTPQRLDRAEAWFQRWGNAGVLVGEITPLLRSFVPIPAGVFETPFVPFALMTLAASAIWSFAIGGIGYALGASYERFQHDFRYVEIAILAGVLVLAAYLLLRVRRAGTVRRRDDPAR